MVGAKTFFFLLFSEALSLFVGFIVIFIVTFTNSTVFPTMDTLFGPLCTYLEKKLHKGKCSFHVYHDWSICKKIYVGTTLMCLLAKSASKCESYVYGSCDHVHGSESRYAWPTMDNFN